MITLTARWGPWKHYDERTKRDVIIEPTPGRDRPIVVKCSNQSLAKEISLVFKRIGLEVESEETP